MDSTPCFLFTGSEDSLAEQVDRLSSVCRTCQYGTLLWTGTDSPFQESQINISSVLESFQNCHTFVGDSSVWNDDISDELEEGGFFRQIHWHFWHDPESETPIFERLPLRLDSLVFGLTSIKNASDNGEFYVLREYYRIKNGEIRNNLLNTWDSNGERLFNSSEYIWDRR